MCLLLLIHIDSKYVATTASVPTSAPDTCKSVSKEKPLICHSERASELAGGSAFAQTYKYINVSTAIFKTTLRRFIYAFRNV